MPHNTIAPRLVSFAILILDIADSMPQSPAGRHLSGQLIRSGTSPALNYAEARGAESDRDFVHKLNIAIKELRETVVNLEIIQQSGKCRDTKKLHLAHSECNELIAILIASVNTVKRRTANSKQRTAN